MRDTKTTEGGGAASSLSPTRHCWKRSPKAFNYSKKGSGLGL